MGNQPTSHGARRASFVVRVWRDATAPEQPPADSLRADGLRGSVQAVGAGAIRYFASLDDMAGIIGEAVGVVGGDERRETVR